MASNVRMTRRNGGIWKEDVAEYFRGDRSVLPRETEENQNFRTSGREPNPERSEYEAALHKTKQSLQEAQGPRKPYTNVALKQTFPRPIKSVLSSHHPTVDPAPHTLNWKQICPLIRIGTI
jgi:hypothetical protein